MDEPNEQSPIGFEKMRAMLARAADLRSDEQRQVVDLIDEVRVRLTPLEGFAADGRSRIVETLDAVTSIKNRVGDLAERSEVASVSSRVDETMSRIAGQDAVLAQVISAMTALSDRVGSPLEALQARLEGVAGRFEGVSGRLDGLDDRLQHLHSRLDELDTTIGRVQGTVESLPAQLDPASVHRRFDELSGGVQQRLDEEFGRVHGRMDDLAARPAVDPTERFDGLAAKLEQLAERLEALAGRVKAVDDSVRNNAGAISGSLEQGVDKISHAVDARPDRDELGRTLQRSQQDSERRITQQLDGALADFAEVMLGPSAAQASSGRGGGRKAAKKSDADDED